MKSIIKLLLGIVWGIMYLTSCQSNSSEGTIDRTEVMFSIMTFDAPVFSKANENQEDSCISNQNLILLAQQNKLSLSITVDHVTYQLRIIYNGQRYVSQPLILGMGSHSIEQATVIDDENNILYSAVGTTSKYAPLVNSTLPKTIVIGNGPDELPLYTKPRVNLDVICVQTRKPKEFGFVKWNVDFTKLYCLPFIVNICDKNGEDFTGRGTIRVENGTFENSLFIPFTERNELGVKPIDVTERFPNAEIQYGRFCFADNYTTPNEKEYYRITLNITTPFPYTVVGYANINELIQYADPQKNNAWDESNNIIHFNFCESKIWFFK